MQTMKPTFRVTGLHACRSADDLIVILDMVLGCMTSKQRVRLSGVDAPTVNNSTKDNVAVELRNRVQKMIVDSKQCWVCVDRYTNGGDIVGTVYYCMDGVNMINLNQELIDLGYVFSRGY